MNARLRRLWPAAKALLALAIIIGVAWQFAKVLRNPDLERRPLHPRFEWLIGSAVLYLLGLGLSAVYWYWLLRSLGEKPPLLATIRAYYIGHLGKYVPGKVWALVLRTAFLQGTGVRTGVAAMTATYETLVTMAAGALLAAVLFAIHPLGLTQSRWALGLLGLAGIPVLPAVFNRIVRRLTGPFLQADAAPLPALRMTTLFGGLALTAVGWLLQGASLAAMLQALLPESPPWTWTAWAQYTASVSLAYVAGFVVLVVPSGLGVREFLLQQFLARELEPLLDNDEAAAWAVVIVLVLRLTWTVAEMGMMALVYCLPRPKPVTAAQQIRPAASHDPGTAALPARPPE